MGCRNNRLILASIVGLILTGVAAMQANKDVLSAERIGAQLAKRSIEFEENRGQFDKRVRYLARGAGYSLFLTADEAVYVLPLPNADGKKGRKGEKEIGNSDSAIRNQRMFALRMKIAGANSESLYRGEEVREHRTNYFKGNNPENWQTDVPSFSRVVMQDVYPGVSMVWHGKEQSATQYDFVVEPNGNADQIALEFDGAEKIELDAEGNLLIHTEAGTIKQTKPFTYQETDGIKQEVESGFVIEQSQIANRNPQVRFSLGEYDRSKPLTIDPYSTYLGGSAGDVGTSIAFDAMGNVYVTGRTNSTNFPTAAGVFDTTHNGLLDVFVTKLNAAGSGLIYSTYIGGNSNDLGFGIAVIGGGDFDFGYDIAIDSSGNAYLTGHTFSSGFPVTAGAFDTINNGGYDVFATKLNAAGSALIYSTFLGGGLNDEGYAIAIDSSGNSFLAGRTTDHTTDFPVTAGAFDTTHNGFDDIFVTKLNPTGTALIYSTFIGGSTNTEIGRDLAIDSSGNAFLTGVTGSNNYPTTAGAFDTTHNGNPDVFVTKLNAAGSALIYSTFIGGNAGDDAAGIAIDSSGNAFVTGVTDSLAYPTTAGAYDTTHNGQGDVFVTKLDSTGTTLSYSTFIGGSNYETGYRIAFDPSGNVFVTGATNSTDFPTTAGAYDTTKNGIGDDAFVTSVSLPSTAATVSVGGRVTVGENGISRARVTLTGGNGATRSVITGSFGYFRFDEVPAGATYIIEVNHKRYLFTPQLVTAVEDLTDLNFTAQP